MEGFGEVIIVNDSDIGGHRIRGEIRRNERRIYIQSIERRKSKVEGA